MSEHEFTTLVSRLRDAACQAAKGGAIAESAPHPDAELLELCAKVLDLRAEYSAIDREARKMSDPPFMGNPAFAAEMQKRDEVKDSCRAPMARLCKFQAKTAAGIYAKAHVLRVSHGGAPRLALSVAEDLINCPGLRASLWPATERA
jgi:hypothetical protein